MEAKEAREIGELTANLKNLGEAMEKGFEQINTKIDNYRAETQTEVERIRASTENFRIVHENSDGEKFKRVYEKIDLVENTLSNRLQIQERNSLELLQWKSAEETAKKLQLEQKEKSWGHKVLGKLKDRIGDGLVLFAIGFIGYLLWQYLGSIKP